MEKISDALVAKSPLIVGAWRVAVLLILAGLFYLNTIFIRKDDPAFANLPRAVEKLTEIAELQKRYMEQRMELPNRVALLERLTTEQKNLDMAQNQSLVDTERRQSEMAKQVAVMQVQLTTIIAQIQDANRKLEKIGDRMGVP